MEKIKSNFSLVLRLIPYYKQNLKIFIFDLVFAITTTFLDLTFPLMIKHLIHLIIQSKPGLVLELTKLGFLYIFVLTVELIGTYFMNYIGHTMGARIETKMRSDLFEHCQKLPISYHDNNKIGQIVSRLTSDLFEVGEFAHHAPEDILIVIIKIIMPFAILFTFSWQLTIFTYASLPIMFFAVKHCFKKMKVANQQTQVQIGELNAKIEDSLLGLKLVKSFANESLELDKFNHQNKRTLTKKIKFYKAFGTFRMLNRLVYCIIVFVFILGGVWLLVEGKTDSTTILITVPYVDKIMNAIYKILGFSDMYQKGLTGINRFCEILDIPIKPKLNEINLDPENTKGSIEFKNVYFSYEPKLEPIIKNLNLKINPNEKIAIVGSSGSGKTTICNLIKNFYSVQQGEILIDGINVENISSKSLHQTVGLVQQNVYLLTGTIADNIKFGKPNATFEEVVLAAKKAKIFNFINSLELGFHTHLGERGTKLSGGQKQQISIARLFLQNPKILILDEATCSLDSENEKLILQTLQELSKNKTTITIAHKLHTLKSADIIYLIQNGQIVESGTHETLLKKTNSIYHKFYSNFY